MKLLGALLASAFLLACSAVKEESFGRLKAKNGPIVRSIAAVTTGASPLSFHHTLQVTLFYNQDADNFAEAESIMIQAEKVGG